jgi:hypothetical protein
MEPVVVVYEIPTIPHANKKIILEYSFAAHIDSALLVIQISYSQQD